MVGKGKNGISFLPPLPTPQWTWRARNQPPPPLYIVGMRMGASPFPWRSPLPPQYLLLLCSAWRSPAGIPQAPPPRRCAAGSLPQLLLSACWIKKEETSLGCTCVEHGGAVRSALDRVFRDLNRCEYDSIIRVLVTLPLSDLQRYEDAHPLSLSPSSSLIVLGEALLECRAPSPPPRRRVVGVLPQLLLSPC